MVFNPNLDGGVRFDQPVQQPTSPVANIVQGLGIFNRGGERSTPTEGALFDSAVAHIAEDQGISTDISSWTEQNLRAGGAMYPRFATRMRDVYDSALSTEESRMDLEDRMGGGASRARAIAIRDWTVDDPYGVTAEMEAYQLYPDDQEARAAHVERAFLEWNTVEMERAETLAQRDQGVAINQLSDEIWDTELSRLRMTATGYATTFSDPAVIARLSSPEGIPLSEVAPELAALLGQDIVLNRGNLRTQFAALQPVIANQILNMVRADYQDDDRELNAPDADFINSAFAPLIDVFAAIDEDTDPTNRINWLRSQDAITVRELMEENGYGNAWTMIGSLPETAGDRVMAQLLEDPEFLRLISRQENSIAPGSDGEFNAANASVDEAEARTTLAANLLGVTLSGDSSLVFENTYQNFSATLRRAGITLGSTYVSSLLDTLALNPDQDDLISNIIREEFAHQIDNIQGLVSRANGTLTYDENSGQLVVTQGLVQEGMGTAPAYSMDDFEGQAQLDQLNAILGVTEGHEALQLMGDDFIGAVMTGVDVDESVFVEGLHTAPTGATIANIEQGAPGYTESDRFSRVYGSDSMTPAFYDDGTLSEAVRPGADRRMHAVLQGPFQDAQNIFGEAIPINDALAQQGTTRVTQTPGSRHFHGDAIDINISGMSPERQIDLLNALMQAGFQGFGFGAGILHADMGERRYWNYLNDDLTSTAFGGTPLGDLYAMVEANTVSRANLPVTGASAYSAETISILSGTEYSPRGLEYDPEEGIAMGMTYLDEVEPATVEQEPVGDLGATEVEQQESTTPVTTGPSAAREGNRQIEALIAELTRDIDLEGLDEEIIQEIRGTMAGALGLQPTQRPTREGR